LESPWLEENCSQISPNRMQERYLTASSQAPQTAMHIFELQQGDQADMLPQMKTGV
jgi:hypothetical protein